MFRFRTNLTHLEIPGPLASRRDAHGNPVMIPSDMFTFRNGVFTTDSLEAANCIRKNIDFKRRVIVEETVEKEAVAQKGKDKIAPVGAGSGAKKKDVEVENGGNGDALVVPEVKTKNEAITYLVQHKGVKPEEMRRYKTIAAISNYALKQHNVLFENLAEETAP